MIQTPKKCGAKEQNRKAVNLAVWTQWTQLLGSAVFSMGFFWARGLIFIGPRKDQIRDLNSLC